MHTHTLVPRCQEDPVLRTALLPFGNAHKAAFAAAHCRTPRINYAGGKYIAWPSLSPFFMFITEHAFKANASCWWKSLVGFSGSGFIAHMEPFGCVFSVSCKHSCMSQHRHVVQFGGRRHTPTSRQVAHVVEGHWASAAQIGESEWGAAPARRHSHTSTPPHNLPHNLPRNPPNGPPGRTLLLAVPGRAASGDGVLGSRTHVCSGDVFGLRSNAATKSSVFWKQASRSLGPVRDTRFGSLGLSTWAPSCPFWPLLPRQSAGAGHH